MDTIHTYDRRALLRAGIPPRYIGLGQQDLMRFQHWAEICRFVVGAEEVFAKGLGMILFGETITGKSAAAATAAIGLATRGKQVCFASAYQIHRDIDERAFDKEYETSLEAHYYSVDLLVVDDLGSEQPLTKRASHVPHVLMTRFQKLKPTIVTTALTMQADFDAMRIYPKGILKRMCGWMQPLPCTMPFAPATMGVNR